LISSFQRDNDIAKRLQRATTWYSKAVDADTPEEQFVALAIALESLLVGDEGKGLYAATGSINQKLSERTAFLLADDFESRRQQSSETKKLYGLRSAIVHRGESVRQKQLIQMDRLVKQSILAFLKRDFKNWNEFEEWIARQRFGSGE
jgi:hypothetical protein